MSTNLVGMYPKHLILVKKSEYIPGASTVSPVPIKLRDKKGRLQKIYHYTASQRNILIFSS